MNLTSEQYDAIMRDYSIRRRNAVQEKERRRRELIDHIPAYRELEESVSSVAAAFTESLKSDTSDPVAARQSLAGLRAKREQAMLQAGYPVDYLENVYTCAACKDTGYIDNKERCSCLKKRIRDVLFEQSHLQTLARDISFDRLREDVYGDDTEALGHFRGARDEALRFCDAFPDVPAGLLFMGNVGTGKTALSVCIASRLLEEGYSVLYFSAVSLFEQLAAEHFLRPGEEKGEDLLSALMTCDLLIIDDLGTELTNSFVIEQLFGLLNERGIRGQKLVISTNLGLSDLQQRYEDRIFSRMTSGFTIMLLTGPDIRQHR